MGDNEKGFSNLSNIFLSNVDSFFLPSYYDFVSNECKSDTKEELPTKQQIKFISIKQVIPQVNLLQKKINLKRKDYTVDSENSNSGRWTKEEQYLFAEAVLKYGNDWKSIQSHVSSRNITQVRSHAQKFLMKLKESNHLINKGLDVNLSWTKIINYLNKTLTYNELKEVLFSVEQTGAKQLRNSKSKNLKKIHKQSKKNSSKFNNDIKGKNKDDEICNYDFKKDLLNLNEEEDNYNIQRKMIKEEEEEKELQKFIECFNSSSSEITLNSSFDENSNKDEEDMEYYFNQEEMKYKKYIF